MHKVKIAGIPLGMTEEEECAAQDAQAEREINVRNNIKANARGEHYLNLYFAGDGAGGTMRPWRPGDGVFPRGNLNIFKEITGKWHTPGISYRAAQDAASAAPGPQVNQTKPTSAIGMGSFKLNFESGRPDNLYEWLCQSWIRYVVGDSSMANKKRVAIREWPKQKGFYEFSSLPTYKKIVIVGEAYNASYKALANQILSGQRAKMFYTSKKAVGEFVAKQSPQMKGRARTAGWKRTAFHKNSKRFKKILQNASAGIKIPFWMYMIAKITEMAHGGNAKVTGAKPVRTSRRLKPGERTGTPMGRRRSVASEDRKNRWERILDLYNGKPYKGGGRGYTYIIDPAVDRQRFMETGLIQNSQGKSLKQAYMLISDDQMDQKFKGKFKGNSPRDETLRRTIEQANAAAGSVRENKEVISWARYLSEEKKRKVQESKGKKTISWQDFSKEKK
jgi:hypothetical protein